MSRRTKLWLAWFFIAFGALNCYGPSLNSYRRLTDPPTLTNDQIVARLSRPQLILEVLRDASDTRRYFAYANAILGRPASKYYIRSTSEWGKVETVVAQKDVGLTGGGKHFWPWRDFSVEYPPGMLVLILLPALLTKNFSTFHFLFSLEMEALLTLSVYFAVKTADRMKPGAGERALAWSLASLAALGVVAVRRYDACVSLSVSAAVLALAARRPALSGVAWAGGVIAKGVPIVLAPLALFWHVFQADVRGLVRAALAAALCFAIAAGLYFAIAGSHYADAFLYHARRPLQFETFYGGALMFLQFFKPHVASLGYSYGSENIVSPYEPVLRHVASIAPFVAMLGVFFWAFLRMRRARAEMDRFAVLLSASCACLVAFASLGKIYSPQYLVWLIPLGALASLRQGGRAGKWMIAAFVLAQLEYPFLYSGLTEATYPLIGAVIVLRNLALWIWVFFLLREPYRSTQMDGVEA